MSKTIKISFTDEEHMMDSIKVLKDNNIGIYNVYSPFPVHGLDKLLNYSRSRLPKVGFIFGALGGILALVFQWWVFSKAYPLNIGGKPLFAFPSFIPVTFEVTILLAGIGMIIVFLLTALIDLSIDRTPHDYDVTNNKFVVYLEPEFSGTEEELNNVINKKGVVNIINNDAN